MWDGKSMDENKKKELEAKGWCVGDAEDFLELTPMEIREVETQVREMCLYYTECEKKL
jgi:hypothetical protein